MNDTEKMKAIVLTAFGGPEVLRLSSVPKPKLKAPNEILIKVLAAGINAGDVRVRQSMPPLTGMKIPAEGIILGMEGAGIIEEVGSDVTRFKVGDEVFYFDGGFAGVQGSYAEYKTIDENYAALKPTSVSFAEAATLPVVSVTSWESLHERINLKKGENLLVQGGAGGLGHIGIQLAKLIGANVATTVSSESKADFVKNLGVDKAIIYRNEDVASAIQQWTENRGVNAVYDTVGDEVFGQSIELLAVHGRIVSAAYPTSWPGNDILIPAALKNNQISFEAMGHSLFSHQARVAQTRILEQIAKLVDDDNLHVKLDRTYELEDVAEAHRDLESGRIMGRLALSISLR